MLWLNFGTFILIQLFSFSLWADCTNSEKGVPGKEGEIQWDATDGRFEYCDFNNWRNMKYDNSKPGYTQIYSEDFEAAVPANDWGTDIVESFTTFLGRISASGGAQGTSKSFTLSGSQDSTTISFDVYFIDSWAGATFFVYIDDTEIFQQAKSTNFFNTPVSGTTGSVTYSGTTPIPISYNMGYNTDADQKVRFTLDITNPGATTVKLGFGSNLAVAPTTAGFGIDNLQIDEVTASVPTIILTDDFESGIPADDWGAGAYVADLSSYLGRFDAMSDGAGPNKTISLSGSLDYTVIEMDIYKIDSWDGEQFYVHFDNTDTYSTTFDGTYQTFSSGSSGNLSWTVTNNYPQRIELAGDSRWPEQSMHYIFTYTNPNASDINVGFSAYFNESRFNESYGVDNITVTEYSGATPTLAYSEDFESGIPANDWGTDVTVNWGSFLGRIAGTGGVQGPNKTITLPGTQTSTRVTFDLIEAGSWDNENLTIYINDVAVTTENLSCRDFDVPSSGSTGSVSWTATNVTPITADFGLNTSIGCYMDQIFNYDMTITNPGATSIKIGFGSNTSSSSASEEGFGVDNILVESINGGPTTEYTDDFEDGVGDRRWNGLAVSERDTRVYTQVLGMFNGSSGLQDVNKTYSLSGSQTTTKIIFDVIEAETWDDEDWFVYIDDTLIFSEEWRHNTTQTASSGSNAGVTWTGTNIKAGRLNMGGPWSYEDQVYQYELVITNPGATNVKIGFGSNTNSAASNESYAIDNVSVIEVNGSETEISFEDFESGASGWSENITFSDYGSSTTVARTRTETGVGVSSPYTSEETSNTTYTYERTRQETDAYFGGVLGRIDNTGQGQGTFKTFTLPGTQDTTEIRFDLLELDSFDSERFNIYIDDTVVLTATRSTGVFEVPNEGSNGNVSWRVNNLTTTNANLGFNSWNDQLYRYTFLIDNPGATEVKIGFGLQIDEDYTNESIAIDNVTVAHHTNNTLASLGACSQSGQQYYDAGNGAWVWCDGVNLWPYGPPASGAGGCTSPAASAGSLNYDPALKLYRFCDGTGWVSVDNN